ncbi:hypothetical protein B2J93_2054 [Marssonina coronariae]|uniref:Uncharacterized protein n=1 Tax=Diplocarpon coronariae TaxID=2795749 RepID=A0A218ZGR6_9HELO|nr:hypothetical protein B2J93_2054 [Marssonina coronariae]
MAEGMAEGEWRRANGRRSVVGAVPYGSVLVAGLAVSRRNSKGGEPARRKPTRHGNTNDCRERPDRAADADAIAPMAEPTWLFPFRVSRTARPDIPHRPHSRLASRSTTCVVPTSACACACAMRGRTGVGAPQLPTGISGATLS